MALLVIKHYFLYQTKEGAYPNVEVVFTPSFGRK
jgi:hypothetical protein